MPFAAYSAPFIRAAPGSSTKVQQLLWGDFVTRFPETEGEWVRVRGRGEDGWLRESELQEERLLEVNFVDVGQGDGCFIVTPEDRFLLIDAGEESNMFRFLRWRFNLGADPDRVIRFQAAVLTHPDLDHYGGFRRLLASSQLRFDTLYHNGIVERTGSDVLGPRVKVGNRLFLTDIIVDRDALGTIIDDDVLVGRKFYPGMMRNAARDGRVDDIRMLCSEDGFLPGYETGDLRIEILGPVPEPDAAGRRRLRWFTDAGKTKNGHSVALRMRYNDVSILLGGDLNTHSERWLLQHYAGGDAQAARAVFRSDIAKACHHGSADFTSDFLRAVDAIATIVSSGDDESHAHPRPDALGAIGKFGRGERPLIFSTELARSTRDVINSPAALKAKIAELLALRDAAQDAAARAAITAAIHKALDIVDRSVAVYGMIALRTDGRRVLIAQKLEKPRPQTREEFDVHLLEPDASGELVYRGGRD